MTTTTILIIYTDGKEHKVSGVDDYGYMNGEGQYYFKKNGSRSFLPKEPMLPPQMGNTPIDYPEQILWNRQRAWLKKADTYDYSYN